MDCVKYLEQLDNESSTNKKIEILINGLKNSSDLEEYLRLTFGERIFNVASKTISNSLDIKNKTSHSDIGSKIEWWLENKSGQSNLLIFSGIQKKKEYKEYKEFKNLLSELEDIRGLDAQNLIRNFFLNCKSKDAKWYSRCLVKDLSCGILTKTINKAFKTLNLKEIESFNVALYEKIDGYDINIDYSIQKDRLISKLNESVTMPIYAEPKYDGVRLIVRNCIFGRNRKTEAITRNGKKIETVYFLQREFDRVFEGIKLELDGELMAKDFQTLMTQVHRKNDLSMTMPRQYIVFDIRTYKGNDITYLRYEERRKILEDIFSNIQSDIILLVKNKKLENAEDVCDIYEKSVKAKYEGIMLKFNVPYEKEDKRNNGIKLKPIKTADLEVFDFVKGEKGRHSGKISSLMVIDKSTTVISKVGSGLTDDIIEKITNDPDKYKHTIVEICYDSITKPNEEGKKSLRFPRFISFRFDKNEADSL